MGILETLICVGEGFSTMAGPDSMKHSIINSTLPADEEHCEIFLKNNFYKFGMGSELDQEILGILETLTYVGILETLTCG